MCSIAVEDVFGPTVAADCHNGFDFTLLFEEAFFCILPCSLLLLALPVQLFWLMRQSQRSPAGRLLYLKLVAHLVSFGIKITILILLLVPGLNIPKTRATIPAAALAAATSAVITSLSYWTHSRSLRPSTLLTLFLAICIPLDAIRARTIWSVQTKLIFSVFVAGLASDLVKLILESVEKTRCRDEIHPRSGETTANVFNRNIFWWLNPLLFRGFKQVLEVENLTAIDGKVSGDENVDSFAKKWDSVKSKSSSALIVLLIHHHRWAILAAVLPRLCLTGFTFAQPFLLTRVISFVTETNGPLSSAYGTGLIVATLLIYVGLAVTTANNQHKTYRLITMLRSSLIPLVYRQTLRLDVGVVRDSAALTLMSVDFERISSGLRYMHEIWASPIDVGLALWLLQRQLGVAAVAPAAVFVLCSLVGLGVASTMGSRQRRWLEAIQKRVQVTSEMLKHMKEVRLGGLQNPMASKLQSLRSDEISESRPFKKALIMIVTLSYTTAASGPLLAFAMYSLLALRNGSAMLDYETAYTSLSLLTLLQTPMALILDAIAGVVSAIGALQRIGEYVSKPAAYNDLSSDIKPLMSATILPYPEFDDKKKDTIVYLRDLSAGWDADGFVIKNLDLEILCSTVNFLVGPVACGKTTLLHAILGETTRNEGIRRVSVSKISYCSQTPWISNDTVRHNILGTSVYVQSWYDKVVEACALREDFMTLPHGDQEEVGNGGMTLSGGQKARLGLARAIYARESLLLLDDVFSGLDARTEERIFKNLFGPNGLLTEEKTTVLLATNAMHRLAYADNIIIFDSQGALADEGNYHQVHAMAKEVALQPSNVTLKTENPSNSRPVSEYRPVSLVDPPKGSERRVGDMTVYKHYIQTVQYWSAVIFAAACATFVVCLSIPQFVIKWWLQRTEEYTVAHMGQYLGVYGGLAGLAIISLAVAVWHLTEHMLPRTSTHFHNTLLNTVLNAPLRFFSTTDVGTTINRFAQDLQLSDMELPLALFNTVVEVIMCIAQFIIIAVASKYIGIAMPVLLLVFYLIQKFYLRTARQLRLLDIEAKAPLFSRFLEILSGLVTIRAFGWQDEFERRGCHAFDVSQRPFYLLFCVQRWLNLVLDLVVAGIAVIVVAIAVKTKGKVDAGFLGIALVNIVQFSISIKSLLSNWTQLEISIGAVARIRSFAADTASEHQGDNHIPIPSTWPTSGHIEFQNVTARYEGSSKSAIRGLTLSIRHGEKFALCGRSGSGKSSIVSALFRLLYLSEGTITIDDIDIATIPPETLYTRLVCVTQSPHLISGTIRENIDPLHATEDETVKQVLKEVNLWETVESRGIDAQISHDLFSIGQQQLLCLARAMVRTGCILILDEVTASVDAETEKLMQKIIREHFASRTVITIAHRISTILDADRVAVISNGEVVEIGSPSDLLDSHPPGFFRALYEANSMNMGKKE